MPLDPFHVRILHIAADLPESRTAALAGGGAMLAHNDLYALASRKDRGLSADTFIPSLGAVGRFGPADWSDAGIDAERAERVREVILVWRARLAS